MKKIRRYLPKGGGRGEYSGTEGKKHLILALHGNGKRGKAENIVS